MINSAQKLKCEEQGRESLLACARQFTSTVVDLVGPGLNEAGKRQVTFVCVCVCVCVCVRARAHVRARE